MPINFQCPAIRASLLMFWTLSLGLNFVATASKAAEALPAVRLWSIGPGKEQAYVITHGMGGTANGDRFHTLAKAISKTFPNACVLRVDWSERASAKIYGLPNPYKVAASIDEVGDQAAVLLQQEKIDPQRTVFIGESFGNWVNARIAQKLGGVQGILALNPANEGAGYTPPDLRKHAQRSWSFHTYSVFDTTLEIAGGDFWLETSTRATQVEQHVAGIQWLTARLEANDPSWLHMNKPLLERRARHFQAMAKTNGELSDEQLSRERPAAAESLSNSAIPPARDLAVVTP